MRRQNAPGAAFHFSLFILNFALVASAAAAGGPGADRAEAALGHAAHHAGPAAADRGRAAVVADEQDAAAGPAAADAVAGLLLGPLLEVLFGPEEVPRGQQAGPEQDQGKLAGHAGHGNTSGPAVGRAVMSVFALPVLNLYHARSGLGSLFRRYNLRHGPPGRQSWLTAR